MTMVKFLQGTSSQFNALASKDASTLYFLTDTQQIYKGSVAYTEKVVVGALPESGLQGVLYINTADNLPYYYSGSEFKKLSVAVVSTIDENSSDEVAPSAKAVKTYVDASSAAALKSAKEYTDAEIQKLDGSADVASVSDGVVTIHTGAITETDGVISQAEGTVTLAKVATTGAAADVAIADSGNLLDATTVEAALQEVATKIGATAEAGKVTITEVNDDSHLKSYVFHQGGNDDAHKIGTINIPKDLVVESGSVVKGTWTDGSFTEGTGTGTALKLVIANQANPIYINTLDLVDVYTGESNAEVTISVSDNKISATVGQIAASKITHGETTVEAALTAAEATIAKLDGADTVEGSVAKALKDAKAYADQVVSGGLADLDATTVASDDAADLTKVDNGISVVTDVTQTDGLVSMETAKADKYGAAQVALTDAKAYVDAALTWQSL